MRSPGGWIEPGQTPDFEEYTVVLKGVLRVEHKDGTLDVQAGQAVIAPRGEWVRYSTPEPDGAEYIAVCSPAFTLDAAHRDSLNSGRCFRHVSTDDKHVKCVVIVLSLSYADTRNPLPKNSGPSAAATRANG